MARSRKFPQRRLKQSKMRRKTHNDLPAYKVCETPRHYQVNAGSDLKLTFRRCDTSCLRLKLKKTDVVPEGNHFINLKNLHEHVTDITMHVAVCQLAQELALLNKPPVQLLECKSHRGLASIFEARCNGCQEKFLLTTSPLTETPTGHHYDINIRAVWGTMATGGGASHLNEVMATMDAPGLSQNTFSKIEEDISKWWQNVLEEEMLKAGVEERSIAIEKGSFHQGVPAIAVITDGGWSKRSHKHTYNALGGVAIIVGKETGKLLFVGVRNKYCSICAHAESKKIEAREHECFRNWSASSQEMEADIILEGFLQAEQKHSLRYMQLIADGDSSVFLRIKQEVPVWGRDVEKLECANHACKCLRTSLEKLVEENTLYKGKGKLSKPTRVRLASAVRCAIRMRSLQENKTGAARSLEHDIRNSLYHVFNDHSRCSSDFCKAKNANEEPASMPKETDQEEEEVDHVVGVVLNQTSIWQDVTSIQNQEDSRNRSSLCIDDLDLQMRRDVAVLLDRIASKSERLLGNHTTNLAESWMSVRAKFDGGKMFNRTNRGSWQSRCYGAALRMNLGPQWSPQVWERVTGSKPGSKFKMLFERRDIKQSLSKRYKSTPAARAARWAKKTKGIRQSSSKRARQSYGPESLDFSPDKTPQELARLCSQFYESHVEVGDAQREHIEAETRQQGQSGLWHSERKKRITASKFGQVIKRNPALKVQHLVKQFLYTSFQGNANTRRGLQEETVSIQEYTLQKAEAGVNITVKSSGLRIDPQHPHLACSPDGIVCENGNNQGLLEVKNLLHNKPMNLTQAASVKGSQFCLEMTSSSPVQLSLKKTHIYYYQCQGSLAICRLPWLDLVVRTCNPYQIHIERICYDHDLWESCMKPKLTDFFMKALLPELACPRYQMIPGIREPGLWSDKPAIGRPRKVTASASRRVVPDVPAARHAVSEHHARQAVDARQAVPGARQAVAAHQAVPGARRAVAARRAVPGARQAVAARQAVPGARQAVAAHQAVPGARRAVAARRAVPGARQAVAARQAVPGARQAVAARQAVPGARQAVAARQAIPGARRAVPGARRAVPGAHRAVAARQAIPGAHQAVAARQAVPGARRAVPGARRAVAARQAIPGARQAVPGARRAVPGARRAVAARQAVPGARQAVAARQAVPGARRAVPGARRAVAARQAVPGAHQAVAGARQAVPGAHQAVAGARQAVPGARRAVHILPLATLPCLGVSSATPTATSSRETASATDSSHSNGLPRERRKRRAQQTHDM